MLFTSPLLDRNIVGVHSSLLDLIVNQGSYSSPCIFDVEYTHQDNENGKCARTVFFELFENLIDVFVHFCAELLIAENIVLLALLSSELHSNVQVQFAQLEESNREYAQ